MPTGTVIFPTSFPSWLPQFTTLPPAPALKWSPRRSLRTYKRPASPPPQGPRKQEYWFLAFLTQFLPLSGYFDRRWAHWKENHKGEMKRRGDQNGHLWLTHSSRGEGGWWIRAQSMGRVSPFSTVHHLCPSYAFQSWSPVASRMKQTNYLPCVGWNLQNRLIIIREMDPCCLCLWFLSAHLLGPCCFLLVCFSSVPLVSIAGFHLQSLSSLSSWLHRALVRQVMWPLGHKTWLSLFFLLGTGTLGETQDLRKLTKLSDEHRPIERVPQGLIPRAVLLLGPLKAVVQLLFILGLLHFPFKSLF